jgi:hypothetical protein
MMVGWSMFTNSLSQGLQNPQNVKKIVTLSLGIFGAFHFSRIFFSLLSAKALSTFGKPKLVRETSKITTSNPFLIPFVWSRKFYRNNLVR